MQNETNPFEKEPTKDDKKQKSTKKKSTIISKSTGKVKTDHTSENLQEKDNKTELASFFKGKVLEDNEQTENSDNKENNNTNEEAILENDSANLTEEEVSEITLAIVDARTQEIASDLQNAEADSAEEFEAVAGVIFLEELKELTETGVEITDEVINQAYDEALHDLSIDDEAVSTDWSSSQTPHNQAEYDSNQPVAQQTVTTSGQSVHGNVPNIVTPSPLTGPLTPSNPNQNTQNPAQVMQYSSNISAPVTRVERVEVARGRQSDMLVGVILGYIVGRRGGRKRTEKKLHPKIDRLEEQVAILHEVIKNKEAQIKKVARQNVEVAENSVQPTHKVIERRIIRKTVKETLKRREELTQKPGVEKIGKFSLPALKVFHEKRLPDGTENSPKRVGVEVMTEAELLDKVAGLRIHGLDVANMYRKKRLTLKTLRQITKEYLRGGPFRQTFSLELLPDEEEIEQKRSLAHTAYDNKRPNQAATHEYEQQPKLTKKTEKQSNVALNMQRHSEKKNTQYVISGAIVGTIVALLALIMLYA